MGRDHKPKPPALPALEHKLGLTGLDRPMDLAALAVEASKDPLGFLRVYAPKLLANHIVALTALADSGDPRIRGSALKAAADVTIRALGLLQWKTLGGAAVIQNQEDIPGWPANPELKAKLIETLQALKEAGIDPATGLLIEGLE